MKLTKEYYANLCFKDPTTNELVGYYLDYHDSYITGHPRSTRMQCYSISDDVEIGYEYYCDYFSTVKETNFHI